MISRPCAELKIPLFPTQEAATAAAKLPAGRFSADALGGLVQLFPHLQLRWATTSEIRVTRDSRK